MLKSSLLAIASPFLGLVGVAALLILRHPLKSRWQRSHPDPDLTWGMSVSGAAFAEKLYEKGALHEDAFLLEVGPGYGRILRSLLERGYPFRHYVGLDISERNIAFLQKGFTDPRLEFVPGAAETYVTHETPSTIFASLTFKHLFPSFEPAVANLAKQLAPGGLLIFDLMEARGPFSVRLLEAVKGFSTYIRKYNRREVIAILEHHGIVVFGFDEVWHTPKHCRLLVCAQKGRGSSADRSH